MNAGEIDPKLADRLNGFVTFGSPLDKIAFFFRQRAKDDQVIKRQLIKSLHAFKTKDWDPIGQNKLHLHDDFKSYLSHMAWLNFWDPKDPVDGHLDFYNLGSE